ncbi:hypothetical protein M758_3G078700 [Ceratodon purpureus]|nr:hypothetical protein M758_3G078700 [Ceratodon purpureus]
MVISVMLYQKRMSTKLKTQNWTRNCCSKWSSRFSPFNPEKVSLSSIALQSSTVLVRHCPPTAQIQSSLRIDDATLKTDTKFKLSLKASKQLEAEGLSFS